MSDPHTPLAPPSAAEPDSGISLRYPGYGKLFLIWTAVGLLTSLRYQFRRPSYSDIGDLTFILAFTACYYPWVALTPAVFQLEKKFPLGDGTWSRNLALLALFSLPMCLLASPLMSLLFSTTVTALEPAWTPHGHRYWLVHFPMAEVLFWCSAAGGYFIRTRFQLREQEQRAARLALEKSQLQAGLKQAQLDVLRARLNPHFLFNSLQNISVMTRQDPLTASRMLVRLGDLLRAVLRQDSEPESTLYDEIELTRAYVALEQMRFGDRLEVQFNVAPDSHLAMVPSFLLQPLIENAVIHGLRGVGKTGIISVSASAEGRELVLAVTDNGIGPPQDGLDGVKMGVGLGSTRDRLATMYGTRHTLTMRRLPEGGTEIRIAIPLRFSDNEDGPSPDEQPTVAHR